MAIKKYNTDVHKVLMLICTFENYYPSIFMSKYYIKVKQSTLLLLPLNSTKLKLFFFDGAHKNPRKKGFWDYNLHLGALNHSQADRTLRTVWFLFSTLVLLTSLFSCKVWKSNTTCPHRRGNKTWSKSVELPVERKRDNLYI